MKELEFNQKSPKTIDIEIYYSLDDNKDVIINEEAIREEFNTKLNDIIEGTKIFEKEKMSLYRSLKEATNEELEKVFKDLDINTLFFMFSEINREMDVRDD